MEQQTSGKATQSTTKPTSVKTLRKSLVQSLNKSLRRKVKAPKVMANLNRNVLVDTFDSSISLPLVGVGEGISEGVWRGEQISCNGGCGSSGSSVAQYAEIKGHINVALLQRAIQLGLVEADFQHNEHQGANEVVTQVLLTDVSPQGNHSPHHLSSEMTTRVDQTLALLARYEGSGQCLYQHWLIKLADEHYLWYQHYQHIPVDALEIDEKRMALIGARIAEIYTNLIKS